MPKLKTAPKVMDVVHPNNRQPSPTSRPMVPSRPYMTVDPMLNIPKEDAIVSSVEQTAPTGAPEIDKAAIKAVATKVKPVTGLIASTDDAEQARKEAVGIEQSLDEANDTMPEPPEEPTPPVLSEASPVEDAKPENTNSDEAEAQPPEVQPMPTSDTTTAQNREEELERLIAKGTYAVPINTVKRRRARTAFALLVVLLAVLVALDLLADMNIITLPPGLPHTNFLAG